jgi:hypothetical protein
MKKFLQSLVRQTGTSSVDEAIEVLLVLSGLKPRN